MAAKVSDGEVKAMRGGMRKARCWEMNRLLLGLDSEGREMLDEITGTRHWVEWLSERAWR